MRLFCWLGISLIPVARIPMIKPSALQKKLSSYLLERSKKKKQAVVLLEPSVLKKIQKQVTELRTAIVAILAYLNQGMKKEKNMRNVTIVALENRSNATVPVLRVVVKRPCVQTIATRRCKNHTVVLSVKLCVLKNTRLL